LTEIGKLPKIADAKNLRLAFGHDFYHAFLDRLHHDAPDHDHDDNHDHRSEDAVAAHAAPDWNEPLASQRSRLFGDKIRRTQIPTSARDAGKSDTAR
jgi:hypothetical protein